MLQTWLKVRMRLGFAWLLVLAGFLLVIGGRLVSSNLGIGMVAAGLVSYFVGMAWGTAELFLRGRLESLTAASRRLGLILFFARATPVFPLAFTAFMLLAMHGLHIIPQNTRMPWFPLALVSTIATTLLIWSAFSWVEILELKKLHRNRQCLNCGYSLIGLIPDVRVCPECGK